MGAGLKVNEDDLLAIQDENAGRVEPHINCYIVVFTKWREGVTSPYTWENLVRVLLDKAVNKPDVVIALYKDLNTLHQKK